MTAGLRLVIRGRVQGVGYRVFAARAASELGVRGWVRNRPDGRVEIEAAASDADTLDAFLARLRVGPSGARVDGVDRLTVADLGAHAEFEIRE